MSRRVQASRIVIAVVLSFAAGRAALAGPYDPALFSDLKWRSIGPFRGGRTVGATGVRGVRGLFYIGVNNGGVWKSTDYGRTWAPIFDDQSTGSIGALAVAPSDPKTIYVGSGEGLQRPDLSVGDGVYRSTDGGATWRHLGLGDGQQIPAIVVDPRDPKRVWAAVLGHPYGPNRERGVFRSTDGGETWQNVLFKDENTGAMDVLLDPANPNTVYAVMWAARQAPWEGAGFGSLTGNNGLFKSMDGGATWRAIGAGLPAARDTLGRIGIAIAPSRPARIYAALGARRGSGLYRSDDAGEHWQLVSRDHRVSDRDGDFNEVKVDPKNPDVVYVANVATWKSTDGGKTFTGWRGAPGGDDYHRIWIDPDDTHVILLASDQGAVVTVNGGDTWSSWYNQPTAQFYHVSTDDAFPYRVYGGQQESGSAEVLSRGDDGQITFREWHPVGAEEYGYVAADPLHPGIVYGGKLSRYDSRTGDVQNVTPDPLRAGDYRWVRTMPVLFSPADPRVLFTAANVVFQTTDGGQHWQTISPDLTRPSYALPANVGVFAPLDPEHGAHRGVVYALAPSARRAHLLWAGTDDGLIHVTHDGGAHWRDVTPPELTPWSKVAQLEASHFDTLEAYAAINRFRLDDLRPHVYRTRDAGRTWTEIVAGLPADEVVNTVRDDPACRGLLFAGTERSVYVSFDDGDHWQTLRQNLPGTSVRDLVVHGDDVVLGTHGRGFWILDNMTPLRQLAAASAATGATLYQPATAMRVRWNRNTDTPLPPDEPAMKNPPDGTAIDYVVPRGAAGPVVLEVRDGTGALVRRYASSDPPDSIGTDLNFPDYWPRPPLALPANAGMHRWIWDLRYAPPAVLRRDYPIAAIAGDTPREPRGAWALPGAYTVRLTAGGRTSTQPLEVHMDPRVSATPADLRAQFALSMRLAEALRANASAIGDLRALRKRLASARSASADTVAADSLDRAAAAVETGAGVTPAGRATPENVTRLNGELSRLFQTVQGADRAPTAAMTAGAATLLHELDALRPRLADVTRRIEAHLAAPR